MDAWTDGIHAMLRAAHRGAQQALVPEEEAVVRSLLATILIARFAGTTSGR